MVALGVAAAGLATVVASPSVVVAAVSTRGLATGFAAGLAAASTSVDVAATSTSVVVAGGLAAGLAAEDPTDLESEQVQ